MGKARSSPSSSTAVARAPSDVRRPSWSRRRRWRCSSASPCQSMQPRCWTLRDGPAKHLSVMGADHVPSNGAEHVDLGPGGIAVRPGAITTSGRASEDVVQSNQILNVARAVVNPGDRASTGQSTRHARDRPQVFVLEQAQDPIIPPRSQHRNSIIELRDETVADGPAGSLRNRRSVFRAFPVERRNSATNPMPSSSPPLLSPPEVIPHRPTSALIQIPMEDSLEILPSPTVPRLVDPPFGPEPRSGRAGLA